MGPDFFSINGAELYDLLHGTEADIGNVLNFILPDWVPHPAALRLRRRRDRIREIFQERLEEREAHPDQWENAQDYISYTLKDSATAHLNHLYAAHHTLLMFAAHTSTVASISWTILEVSCYPLVPCQDVLYHLSADPMISAAQRFEAHGLYPSRAFP